MTTMRGRVQVTVDDELAHALTRIDPDPPSRSKLVRDLALRGARAVEDERSAQQEAMTTLLEIADGARDHDLAAVAELASARGDRLP